MSLEGNQSLDFRALPSWGLLQPPTLTLPTKVSTHKGLPPFPLPPALAASEAVFPTELKDWQDSPSGAVIFWLRHSPEGEVQVTGNPAPSSSCL